MVSVQDFVWNFHPKNWGTWSNLTTFSRRFLQKSVAKKHPTCRDPICPWNFQGLPHKWDPDSGKRGPRQIQVSDLGIESNKPTGLTGNKRTFKRHQDPFGSVHDDGKAGSKDCSQATRGIPCHVSFLPQVNLGERQYAGGNRRKENYELFRYLPTMGHEKSLHKDKITCEWWDVDACDFVPPHTSFPYLKGFFMGMVWE